MVHVKKKGGGAGKKQVIFLVNSLPTRKFCMSLLSADYFSKQLLKNLSEIESKCQAIWIQSSANILSTDLDPNCLQMLSADDASRQEADVFG